MDTRPIIRIIRSRIDVARWLQRTPTVDEVRPVACVACGAASRPAGGRLWLHGHGLRDRQLRGPPSPSEAARTVVVATRRYDCQRCPTVMQVVPCEALPRRHYAATAIAFAMALFGVDKLPLREVRERVSPWSVVGEAARPTWITLRRWISALARQELFGDLVRSPDGATARQVAERAAMALASYAPPSLADLPLSHRAFHGGAHMA